MGDDSNVDQGSMNKWRNSLLKGMCNNPKNAIYATFCPNCALASAKSKFDGSEWWFNVSCFSCYPQQIRNYVRSGYQIEGRIGTSDCLVTIFCYPCVVTQLLNEIDSRGPKIESFNDELASPWLAPQSDYSILGDPCDCFMTSCCSWMEYRTIYSNLSGSPFWFSCCMGSCQTQHIVRKSYGIGGNDVNDDCMMPLLCCWNPFYNYQMLSKMRAEMRFRGVPNNFSFVAAPTNAEVPVVIEHGDVHAINDEIRITAPVNRRNDSRLLKNRREQSIDRTLYSSAKDSLSMDILEISQQEVVNGPRLSENDRRTLMQIIKDDV